MLHRISVFTVLLVLAFLATCIPAGDIPAGIIRGTLLDRDTRSPLIGANVQVINTNLGAATDAEGSFEIKNVPVGAYSVRFTFIGYESIMKTDIIVRPERMTWVYAETRMKTLETRAVEVTAGYFNSSDEQPFSSIGFDYEEIRRAPGSGGDVSRILMSLPGVAMVNDQSNSLIVRGGNPVENTFFIDHIEIPNISHFPDQASSGGPIGMVNVDFIRDVRFYSGGFSPAYGDRLSSVMDLALREGNRKEFDGQLDLNFSGFGGVAEGPLGNSGAWLVSARRSYLDLIVKTLDVGSTIAPYYGDLQWKISFDLSKSHSLSFIGLWGDDHNAPDRETGIENDMSHYGRQDDNVRTMGLNWRALWGKGFSNTSVSNTTQNFDQDWYETNTGLYSVRNRSCEQAFKIRNVNQFRLTPHSSVEFGFEGKFQDADYDNRILASTNAMGDSVPELSIIKEMTTSKWSGFLNVTVKPCARMNLNLGMRMDYFSLNESATWSPRFSVSYRISDRFRLSGSAGIFRQYLPILLLSRNTLNEALPDMKAVHTIVGFEHLLTENTRLTVEIYNKGYSRIPLDPSQPGLFILDEGYTYSQSEIQCTGKACTRGVELMIQKKLAKQIYGMASISIFKAKYCGADGVCHDRKYDNRYSISMEGGYKPNSRWEFSMRWIWAGGAPYTPLDLNASEILHRKVLDETRINESRYPDYHSMNIRLDRRFSFNRTNLVFYLSVWNVYNRKNIAEYFWNDEDRRQEAIYQWLILPIFGLEYEF